MGSDELYGITCCAKIVHEDLYNLMFNTSTYQVVQNGIKSQSILKVQFCGEKAFALSKNDCKLIQKYDSRLIKIF